MILLSLMTYLLSNLKELNLNPLNYGLYLPSIGPGKHGQFMNDSSLLMDYALEGNVPRLEVITTPCILLYSCSIQSNHLLVICQFYTHG